MAHGLVVDNRDDKCDGDDFDNPSDQTTYATERPATRLKASTSLGRPQHVWQYLISATCDYHLTKATVLNLGKTFLAPATQSNECDQSSMYDMAGPKRQDESLRHDWT